MDYQKLYRHMAIEHGLLLLESQMREIIDIVLEMHNEKPENCTMDTNYKVEMDTKYKVESNINGWQRFIIDFTVKSKPRCWQFCRPRIDEQDFQFSVWLKTKDKDELYLFKPHIEEK